MGAFRLHRGGYVSNGYKGKCLQPRIYTFVINDLTEAVQKLPVTPTQLGRVTKGAANALLGRVHMQNGDYAAAKAALLLVVSSGRYSLVPNYSDNFDGDTYSGTSKVTDGHEFNADLCLKCVLTRGHNNFNGLEREAHEPGIQSATGYGLVGERSSSDRCSRI